MIVGWFTMLYFTYLCFILVGEFGIWDGSAWWVQAQVLGTKSKEKSSVHCLQDRWKDPTSDGREVGKPWRDLWGLHQQLAWRWVSLCCLWFRLHNRWELPEEQDFLHCMVGYLQCQCLIHCMIFNSQPEKKA